MSRMIAYVTHHFLPGRMFILSVSDLRARHYFHRFVVKIIYTSGNLEVRNLRMELVSSGFMLCSCKSSNQLYFIFCVSFRKGQVDSVSQHGKSKREFYCHA